MKIISEIIKKEFLKRNKKIAIIGVSGGVDSALSYQLTLDALSTISGAKVQAYFLPNGKADPAVHKRLKEYINPEVIDISPIVKSFIDRGVDGDGRIGNVCARIRMILLFDQAKKYNGLVIGTENKSEEMLGYYTRFGDAASDIEPIAHLYKTEVWQLAKEIGVPEAFIKAIPTAGLWEGQTDEGELGFSYEVADKVLKRINEVDFKKELPIYIGKQMGISKDSDT